tara:strand:- start:345 stop:935 length:591 start_codon:yes stop_codon:yes gene_type:complete
MQIHETATIEQNVKIGEKTRVWQHVQIRPDAVIGKNCSIGKNVFIDRGVIIGNNVKIQNGVNIYSGVIIGDDVFLGPDSVFTNDLQPRAFLDDWKITKTILRKGCSIGANATIVCGNVIGAYSMVGAGAVVTQDVAPFSLVMGNPARIIGMVCKNGHRMEQINKINEKVKFSCSLCNEEITMSLDVVSNMVSKEIE